MGQYYDLQAREMVAVKRVSLKNVRRNALLHGESGARRTEVKLRSEITIHSSLKHRSIVQLRAAFEDDDAMFLVMDLIPGIDLMDTVAPACGRHRPLSDADGRAIAHQLCDALAYLHSLEILHRDVKPENVVVAAERGAERGELRVLLLDFGLSRLGLGNSLVGTFGYQAPEVLACGAEGAAAALYCGAADCYSLGVTLFAALTVSRFGATALDAGSIARADAFGEAPSRTDRGFVGTCPHALLPLPLLFLAISRRRPFSTQIPNHEKTRFGRP